MTEAGFDALTFELAQMNLSELIGEIDCETTEELGFVWRPSLMAPSTFDALRREFKVSRITGAPFRISSENSALTIYNDDLTNFRARFWHDTRHAWLGADFSLEGELAVTKSQLNRIKRAGFDESSTEYRLIEADILGQAMYANYYSTFPINQRAFAIRCLTFGIAEAIDLTAAAELPPRSAA